MEQLLEHNSVYLYAKYQDIAIYKNDNNWKKFLSNEWFFGI